MIAWLDPEGICQTRGCDIPDLCERDWIFWLATSINNEFIASIKIVPLWWTFSRHAIDITTVKLKTKTTRKNPRQSTAREFCKSCLGKSWNILQHGAILMKICNFAVFVKSGKCMLLFNISLIVIQIILMETAYLALDSGESFNATRLCCKLLLTCKFKMISYGYTNALKLEKSWNWHFFHCRWKITEIMKLLQFSFPQRDSRQDQENGNFCATKKVSSRFLKLQTTPLSTRFCSTFNCVGWNITDII